MKKQPLICFVKKIFFITLIFIISFPVCAQNDAGHESHHVMGQMDTSFISQNKPGENKANSCPFSVMSDENNALVVQYQEKTYYFCCADCKKLFKENPQRYATKIKTIDFVTSQFKFTPALITVNKNDIVRLIVTSSDVTHGVYIKDYHINVPIEKGEKKVIEFVADKVGKFTIMCSVYCGPGHHQMKATLVVKNAIF